MIIHLIAGLIKNTFYKMSQYFPKPYKLLEVTLMLKMIYLITQQKQI